MPSTPSSIAILGAGSWGTAVALHLARTGQRVLLWAHSSEHAAAMAKHRCNQRYLPNQIFPDCLIPTADLDVCFKEAAQLIVAVPSHAFAGLIAQLPTQILGLAWLTKGLDPTQHCLLSQLVANKWGPNLPIAVISGPSFAREVAQNLPTAMVIAGNHLSYLKTMQALFHHHSLRVYLSQDWIGVQLCGAVKNVLAIACGMSDGLQYGANAKAALITRGLAEMQRLGECFDAKPETFMGLAGVGDLVLTCTDNQSRNRRFGLQLGQGASLAEAEKEIAQVVEGKDNAAQICALAQQYQIDMPICQSVNQVLLQNLTAAQAGALLLRRPARELD